MFTHVHIHTHVQNNVRGRTCVEGVSRREAHYLVARVLAAVQQGHGLGEQAQGLRILAERRGAVASVRGMGSQADLQSAHKRKHRGGAQTTGTGAARPF